MKLTWILTHFCRPYLNSGSPQSIGEIVASLTAAGLDCRIFGMTSLDLGDRLDAKVPQIRIGNDWEDIYNGFASFYNKTEGRSPDWIGGWMEGFQHAVPIRNNFGGKLLQFIDSPGTEKAEADLIIGCSSHVLSQGQHVSSKKRLRVYPPIRIYPLPAATSTSILHINQMPAKGGALAWDIAQRMPEQHFIFLPGYGDQIRHDLPNVSVILNQAHHQMATTYAQAKIYLNTSKNETLGRTSLEAMACGVPVIYTQTPGQREVMRDAQRGYGLAATSYDDAEEWVRLIKEMDHPAVLTRFRELGLERYNWYAQEAQNDCNRLTAELAK